MAKDPTPASRYDRTEDTPTQYRRLDALARLFEYVGVCAAVAVDPETGQLIVAHNKPSDATFSLVSQYIEVFSQIAFNPRADVPVDKLFELIAESASGISSNGDVVSAIGKMGLLQRLAGIDTVRDPEDRLVDSFKALYPRVKDRPDQFLRSQVMQIISANKGSIRGLTHENARIVKVKDDKDQQPKLEKNIERIKELEEEIRIYETITKNLEEEGKALRDGTKKEEEVFLESIRCARHYFAMQAEDQRLFIEKEIDYKADPNLLGKAHDISRLMIDIDKIVKDIRSGVGSIYNAVHSLRTPVKVLQSIVDPESEMHAEMKIARYFVNKLRIKDDSPESMERLEKQLPYIGISKLCCYHCNNVLSALNIGMRGTHGIDQGWIRPEFVKGMPRLISIIKAREEKYRPSNAQDVKYYSNPSPFVAVKPSPIRDGDKHISGAPVETRKSVVRQSLFGAFARAHSKPRPDGKGAGR